MEVSIKAVEEYVNKVNFLNAELAKGNIKIHIPENFSKAEGAEADLKVALLKYMPRSTDILDDANRAALFRCIPVIFDASESVGPYLATVDRDASGQPYRFLDLAQMIASHSVGENDPEMVRDILEGLPYVTAKHAHSEYQTANSMRIKHEIQKLAPMGLPRFFIVNTGAETVENALKAALLVHNTKLGERCPEKLFCVAFDLAFHGRSLGALAVTQRKKARSGFPTFDWPAILYPVNDPKRSDQTLQRERAALQHLYDLCVTGNAKTRSSNAENLEFDDMLERIDGFLVGRRRGERVDAKAFLQSERERLSAVQRANALHCAAVIIEPIQGEGGIRATTTRFMQRLRMLTAIFDVCLICDEVQTGFHFTGVLWAHELFDLPLPPDAVTWAKKFQNGVLFVTEEMSQFFLREKAFNTTWEGDSVGFLRVQSQLRRGAELSQLFRQVGKATSRHLRALADEFPDLVLSPRGWGCMQAFECPRLEVRVLVEEAMFRRGIISLPAGDRALRIYPRATMTDAQLEEAFLVIREAVRHVYALAKPRPGKLEPRTAALEDTTVFMLDERRNPLSKWLPRVLELEALMPPLTRYGADRLGSTERNPASAGVLAVDRRTGTLLGYAMGSPLENHDEQGVRTDLHILRKDTYFTQRAVVHPALTNASEVWDMMMERLFERVRSLRYPGFTRITGLIEHSLLEMSPEWLKAGTKSLLSFPNYCLSGKTFDYVEMALYSKSKSAY